MYALDGTDKQELPYTVTESAYAVQEISNPFLVTRPELKRIFFPHAVTQRATQWERGDDPLTQFSFMADYDEFGQPRQQTAVAVPRRSARRKPLQCFLGNMAADVINEAHVLATHTRTEYAMPDAGLYLYDRVSQVRMFELVAPGAVQESRPGDIQQVLRDQTSAARGIEGAFASALQSWAYGQALPASLHLLNHAVHHYDGNAFTGRDAGKVGPHGTLVRSESLVLTETELKTAYENGFPQTRRPTYLGGNATVPNGAPPNFGQNTGYTLRADTTAGYHAGYYADTRRGKFDFQDPASQTRRGLLAAKKDTLGDLNDLLDHTTQVSYDPYQLLPVKATDPAGLETLADYNYQFMQPNKVVDVNGNTSYFKYSPNGLLQKQWMLSQSGTEGGSEAKPESEFLYDFLRYSATRNSQAPQAIYVHTRQRTHHALDPLDAHPPDTWIEAREFSDGFGRVIQKRAQADDIIFGADGNNVGLALGFRNPAARDMGSDLPPAQGRVSQDSVVVSGWQVYDNKGRIVEKYEPLFSHGWEFAAPLDAQLGAKVTMYYDPRGQLIRTVNPDHTEQRVLFGIPQSLDTPGSFAPTPWESYTYDASDLGSLAQSTATTTVAADPSHRFTPANQVVDALGRIRCAVQRNGTGATDIYVTQSSYDIRGNILSVSDTMGRAAFSYAYDLLNRSLRINSIDAGIRTSVMDALGNFVEYRDSKGSIVLREYDSLNRLVHLWAVNDTTQAAFTLREQILYGDGGSRAQPQAERDSNRLVNRLGNLSQHYDEAGLLVLSRYDFKGNAVEKSRRVISDSAIANGWTAHWNAANADADLDPQTAAFQTNVRFDALNRSIEVVLPQEAKLRAGEANPHRGKITPHYNRAGALQAVELDGAPYVSHLAHNAKGQRLMIAYGNGTITRYAYDPATFLLARLRSERFQSAATNTWQGNGEPLQDCIYRYDPSGNITAIEERVRGCGVENSLNGRDALVRSFAYDAIYRLLSATGRACANRASNFLDFPNCGSYTAPYVAGGAVPNQDNAPALTELYQESYSYDPVGNMLELDYDVMRAGGPQRPWVRSFGIGGLAPDQWHNAATNRATALTVDGVTHSYAFDENGNMRQQDLDTFHTWDHADRMIGYREQAGPSPSVDARYLYGADGIRVKKWVRKGGGQFESTVYVQEVFEYHSWLESGSTVIRENNHIHVMDRQSRIALSRVGDQHSTDAGIPVQYYLADHLGSGTVVLDELGTWVNREDFFSYGETSFGGFRKKRFRFSGKECDEESRIYYHGARFFAPWLARWLSCEPETATASGKSRYEAFANSPEGMTDPDGHKPKIANDYRDIAALKKSVDITYTPSGRFSYASVAVSDKAKAGIGTNTLSESNPGQAQLKKAAAGDWGDKLSFAVSNPGAALYRNDLEKIEKLAFVKKNSSGTALGHIADEMVGHLATKPSGPTVMIGKDKVTMVDATKNMVLHVFGQAAITTLLGRGAADYAGDLHERDQPSLISGKIGKTEERQAIDNYSDMVNNLYGQDIGERVGAKLGITSSTVWTPKLTAKYLNAVQDAIAKEMGWKMAPFSAGDAEVKKFTSLLNEVQGTTPPARTVPAAKSKP
jgi:RHS repeat-associated protein